MEGVTRIGNNTFYYTGNKDEGGSAQETEDDESSQGAAEGVMVGVYDENFEDSRDASDMGNTSGTF